MWSHFPSGSSAFQGRAEGSLASAWRLSGVQPADTSVPSSGLGPRPLPHLATSLPSLFLTSLFGSPSVTFSFFAGSDIWKRLSPKSQVPSPHQVQPGYFTSNLQGREGGKKKGRKERRENT